MAASNYYGFAAGPPYSAQHAPAYSHSPAATSYTVQQTPGVDHSVAPAYTPVVQAARPVVASTAYGGYQAPSAQDYGYGTRQPEPAPQPAVTQNYQQDGYSYGRSPTVSGYEAKPYYQAVATPSQHVATESYYHSNSQSGYSQPAAAYNQSQPQRQVTPVKPVQAVNTSSSNYSTYPTATTGQQNVPAPSVQSYTPTSSYTSSSYNSSPASYSGSNYTSYDAAAYTAANASYYQPPQQPLVPQQPQLQQAPPQQQQQQAPPQPLQQQPKPMGGSLWSGSGTNSTVGGYNKKPQFPSKPLKPKGPPKQPQLHYCEICKISCAGPQTYREHLEGQKHKKKEAALKTGSQAGGSGPRGVQTQLHCELCDVSCTGADAYVAHIRGAKHQKVLKLHTKLGKPIPSVEPMLVNISSGPANGSAGKPALHAPSSAAPAKPAIGTANITIGSSKAVPVKKPLASKLTFTGANKAVRVKPEEAKGTPGQVATPAEQLPLDSSGDGLGDLLDVQPVGHDYVEEVHNDKGKMVRFHCKLCECSFNDPNAKDMHLKGRRHRLQYKKKVNPDLPVEIKPSNRARKMHEEKLKKQQLRALVKRRREEEQRWHLEMRRYEEEMYWRRVEEEQLYWEEQQRRHLATDWHPPPLMGRPGVPVPPLLPARRPNSDDRHIMSKHSSIYPTEDELQAIQTVVSHSERALRLVSDWLTGQETGKEEGSKEQGKTDDTPRVLKGVMRVGVLAKGLLLRGDRNVRLILLSAQKPTLALLQSIAEELPNQLGKVTSEDYQVASNSEEAHIVIAACREPKMQVTVSLTSPLMREEVPVEPEAPSELPLDSSELLSQEKCLESLAALRHAKWFQARANGLQSCVIIIRVLRDLCQRVPTWGALPDWALELLVERVLTSSTGPLGPGEALRRVLECIATGMLLADGPGLQDPCEKEPVDALRGMAHQQREDVTASSQHALRMLAFRQIHKVLGMEPLPLLKSRLGAHTRKRRWDTDEETEGEGEGKKDKKEEDEKEDEDDDDKDEDGA